MVYLTERHNRWKRSSCFSCELVAWEIFSGCTIQNKLRNSMKTVFDSWILFGSACPDICSLRGEVERLAFSVIWVCEKLNCGLKIEHSCSDHWTFILVVSFAFNPCWGLEFCVEELLGLQMESCRVSVISGFLWQLPLIWIRITFNRFVEKPGRRWRQMQMSSLWTLQRASSGLLLQCLTLKPKLAWMTGISVP